MAEIAGTAEIKKQSTANKIIKNTIRTTAGVVGGIVLLNTVGCAIDSPIKTPGLENAKQAWQAQDEQKQKQEAKKTADSGNIQVDQFIKDAVDKGVSQEVDPAKLHTAEKGSSFEPNEIFLIQPGTTYIKGKLTMGIYDKVTNKFYKFDKFLNYEKNPTPIWVNNEINQDSNVNTGARLVIAFQNDGINPAEVLDINNRQEFLASMNDTIDQKVPGTYNLVNLTNSKITAENNGYSFAKETPNDISSYNFVPGNETATQLFGKDPGIQEVKTMIQQAAGKK